jgi:hypothetical protein
MDTLTYYRDLTAWHYRKAKRKARFRLEMRVMAAMNWAQRRWPSLAEEPEQ